MKKIAILSLLLLYFSVTAMAGIELEVLWEKSAAQESLPSWFDTSNLTRGLSYGKVGDNDRVFVVSRNGGNIIYYLDAASGDTVGRLDNTGIAGGTYLVSDVGVSQDGKIYVCNLAIGSILRVYAWDDEADTPTRHFF